jgi:hypothetical protein
MRSAVAFAVELTPGFRSPAACASRASHIPRETHASNSFTIRQTSGGRMHVAWRTSGSRAHRDGVPPCAFARTCLCVWPHRRELSSAPPQRTNILVVRAGFRPPANRFRRSCKPISVCPVAGGENHLSERPYPEPATLAHDAERAAPRFPIWSCTGWGFPCRLAYAWRGGLLPHLFTLTF